MELRHLRYFVAVAEEEHLARAARRLHLSPPPLSKQIQQLEDELGVALFARVGRGLRLTGAGRVFLDRARRILAEVGRSVAAVQASARGELGHLTIGFTETAAHAEIIPAATVEMRRRHPAVSIELLPMNWPDEIPALLARKVDAALCNVVPDEPGVESLRLPSERIVLALPRTHPLARQRTVSVRAIRDEPFIWIPRAAMPDAFRQTVAEFAARGISVRVAVEARSSATRVGMVAAGMGLTFVLESTRSLLPREVVLRPMADLPLTLESVLAWRAEDGDAPAHRSWREIVQAVARARRSSRTDEASRGR